MISACLRIAQIEPNTLPSSWFEHVNFHQFSMKTIFASGLRKLEPAACQLPTCPAAKGHVHKLMWFLPSIFVARQEFPMFIMTCDAVMVH
jgi:hypothetical protein